MGVVVILTLALIVATVVVAFKYGVSIGEEIGFDEAVEMFERNVKEEQKNV